MTTVHSHLDAPMADRLGTDYARSRLYDRVIVERAPIIDVPIGNVYLFLFDMGSTTILGADLLPEEQARIAPNTYNLGASLENRTWAFTAPPQMHEGYAIDLESYQQSFAAWQTRHRNHFPDQPVPLLQGSVFVNQDMTFPVGEPPGDSSHFFYPPTIPNSFGNPFGSVFNSRFDRWTDDYRHAQRWISATVPLISAGVPDTDTVILQWDGNVPQWSPSSFWNADRWSRELVFWYAAIVAQIESLGGRARLVGIPNRGTIPPDVANWRPNEGHSRTAWSRWVWWLARTLDSL